MASVFHLYIRFQQSPHDITPFHPRVVIGPPDAEQNLFRSLKALVRSASDVSTNSLYLQQYPDQGQRLFDPEITIEFCDEGMKLMVGRWNGVMQWFVSNPDSTVIGLYGWFHVETLFLLPLEKRLNFCSVMSIARYDCASTDALAGHDHYRIRVVVSPTKWETHKPYPVEKAKYTLHIACGTALLQDFFLFLCGNRLEDGWGIFMIGMSDGNGWREGAGQTVYFSETKQSRIRVRDLDWDHRSFVWLMPVKR